MAIGLVGRKRGITRVFKDDGVSVPVTVIEVEPNYITQVKTTDIDGYTAIQVSTGSRKLSRVTKGLAGHYAKAKVAPGRRMCEFLIDDEKTFTVGEPLTVDIFTVGQIVDVAGTTKGKGFAGVIKRYHFATQDATHGNSLSHRAPGSIGMRQTPGRVFKGKKMAGHMGNKTRTIQNLEVVQVDNERNLILIKGSVPGAPGCDVIIKPAVKCRKAIKEAAHAS